MKYSINNFIKNRPKTKIVCTIGPSTGEIEILKKLIKEGMSVARLNLSHGETKEHIRYVENCRKSAEELKVPLGILIDIPGPKYRVGKLPNNSISLKKGQKIILGSENEIENGIARKVKVWPEGLKKDLNKIKIIFLDDGAIKLNVQKTKGNEIFCTVINTALLKSNKSVTIPGSISKLDYFTEETVKGLKLARKVNATFVGLSFIRNEKDVKKVKEYFKNSDFNPQLISKIELPSSVPYLKEIIYESDGVMVARGDLGVQLPLEKVPRIQKIIIEEANHQGKPVITATQMLESMIESPSPTRAEATDIHNAVMDGTDAIMLSAESAAGSYPVEVVSTMDKVAIEVEKDPIHRQVLEAARPPSRRGVSNAITVAAREVAETTNVKAICCFTHSGTTALLTCRERPRVPIIALTPKIGTARRLTLNWGLHCVVTEEVERFKMAVVSAARAAREHGFASKKDKIIVTAGVPFNVPGTTNILRVAPVREQGIYDGDID